MGAADAQGEEPSLTTGDKSRSSAPEPSSPNYLADLIALQRNLLQVITSQNQELLNQQSALIALAEQSHPVQLIESVDADEPTHFLNGSPIRG